MATRALNPVGKLPRPDQTETLLRALIAQEQENRASFASLKNRLAHEVERGDRMLAEAGLAPVR